MKKIIVQGAKSRAEEVPHIRIILRRGGYNEEFIIHLREVALEYLPPAVIAKVPPPYFSDYIRSAYHAKGISLEWNLIPGGDIGATGDYPFFFAARKADLTLCEQSAAALLFACLEALEEKSISARVNQNILDAYAMLDSDTVETGRRFKLGRKFNTGSIIRKRIAYLLKNDPTLKNPKLWSIVADKPPRGWTACDNRIGKYLEGPKAKDNMGYERFCTVCGEERKKIKL